METEQLLRKISNVLSYVDGRVLTKEGHDLSTKTHQGYRQIYFDGKPFLVHRLVFFMHNGYFPKIVDHINGNKEDNRIENLQGCDQKVNMAKAKVFSTNKTGFKGVHFNKHANKYEAYYWNNYKKIYCGLYDTAEEAFKAREMKRKYSVDN